MNDKESKLDLAINFGDDKEPWTLIGLNSSGIPLKDPNIKKVNTNNNVNASGSWEVIDGDEKKEDEIASEKVFVYKCYFTDLKGESLTYKHLKEGSKYKVVLCEPADEGFKYEEVGKQSTDTFLGKVLVDGAQTKEDSSNSHLLKNQPLLYQNLLLENETLKEMVTENDKKLEDAQRRIKLLESRLSSKKDKDY
eukprot:TRINITY_DN5239_c0_g2_i1.p1 TRINITY_DN5239_c0_g2~~TRINITY_DN5239_c0_g2_i1.p1  ORF type:complete len:194 (+),score=62.94 TRINITY_DN5239_c0_g2_i1:102-683(+)